LEGSDVISGERCPAFPPSSRGMNRSEDPITRFNESLGLKSKVGERLRRSLEPLPQPLRATVDSRVRGEDVLVQFNLRIDKLEEPRKIFAADQLVAPANDLHVVLRHSPRSIAQTSRSLAPRARSRCRIARLATA